MNTTAVLLDSIALVLGCIIFVWAICVYWVHRKHWYHYIAIGVWSAHLIVFYAISLWRNLGYGTPVIGEMLHNWSIVLRLQGIITAMTLAYIIYLRERNERL